MSSAKRSRTTISCSVCRKRKSKCDRSRPVCGSCKKKSIAHLCSYDDDTSSTQVHYYSLDGNGGFSPGTLPSLHDPLSPFPGMQRPPLIAMGTALGPTGLAKSESSPDHAFVPNMAQNGNGAGSNNGAWCPPQQAFFDQFRSPSQSHVPQLSPSLNSLTNGPSPQNLDMTYSHGNGSGCFSATQDTGSVYSSSLHTSQGLRPRENSLNISPKAGATSSSSVGSSISLGRSQSQKMASHQMHQNPTTTLQHSASADAQITQASIFGKDPHRAAAQAHSARIRSKSLSSASFGAFPPPKSDMFMEHVAENAENDAENVVDPNTSALIPPHMGQVNGNGPRRESNAFQHLDVPPVEESRFISVSIGSNVLRISAEDTIDMFSCASSTLLVEGPHWQQQGPLSYVGLTKRDQFFKLVRNFTVRLFRSEQFSQFVPQSQRKKGEDEYDSNESDLESEAGTKDSASNEDILNEDTLVTTKIYLNEGTTKGNCPPAAVPGLQSLHALHYSKGKYFRFVAENVASILPCRAAVSDAINKYFQYVHPFVPIIDEATFIKEIAPLFRKNTPGSAKYELISISNDSQLTTAAQLLLVVRLGYMTLIPNTEARARFSKVEQSLIREITAVKADHYLAVVNMCVSEEKVRTKSTLGLVQSLCLLLFYRSVAPNDCLGLSGTDSQLLHGALVSHALSCGLNRDPLKFTSINSIPKDDAFVNIWRALWNYIVNLDASLSMYSGTPLKLPSLSIADTEKPQFPRTSENVAIFSKTYDSVCLSYRRIVQRTTNLISPLKVTDLLVETSKLERIFLETFGKDFFRDYICGSAPENVLSDPDHRIHNEEAYLKVHRFLLFINTRANLSCLYYLVVIHYEQKLDENPGAEAQAGIELFKIFIRSVVQLVYIMSYVLDNMHELFGKSYDYLLTSRIERSMIKTHTFISGFFIRLVNYKRTLAIKELERKSSDFDPDAAARCEIVDSLFTISLLEAELFVGHFRALSKTYINSYKLYVMAFFVLKQCMENPELLLAGVTNSAESFFNDGTNLIQFLSTSELQSLCKLCEEFRIAKLESVRRQNQHQKEGGRNLQPPTTNESKDGTISDNSRSSPNYKTGAMDNSPMLADELGSQASGTFDAAQANRAMYANADTVNTYGLLTEKHMHQDFQGEVFDEQNMIGNDELLKLFDTYGLLDV